MNHEFIICRFGEIEDTLMKMKSRGYIPISHSIWVEPHLDSFKTYASFIFKKKSERSSKDADVLHYIKERMKELSTKMSDN